VGLLEEELRQPVHLGGQKEIVTSAEASCPRRALPTQKKAGAVPKTPTLPVLALLLPIGSRVLAG
jgi:hypothetical protein